MSKKKNDFIVFIYKKYIFTSSKYKFGLYGFPSNSSGRALSMISGGVDSVVAAYKGIKKGLFLDYIFFSWDIKDNMQFDKQKQKIITLLKYLNKFSLKSCNLYIVDLSLIVNEIKCSQYKDLQLITLKKLFYLICDILCQKNDYSAIITGESLCQVSTQTLSNLNGLKQKINTLVLQPLIFNSKDSIINYAQNIKVNLICRLPGQDLCDFFSSLAVKTFYKSKKVDIFLNSNIIIKLQKYIISNKVNIINVR